MKTCHICKKLVDPKDKTVGHCFDDDCAAGVNTKSKFPKNSRMDNKCECVYRDGKRALICLYCIESNEFWMAVGRGDMKHSILKIIEKSI